MCIRHLIGISAPEGGIGVLVAGITVLISSTIMLMSATMLTGVTIGSTGNHAMKRVDRRSKIMIAIVIVITTVIMGAIKTAAMIDSTIVNTSLRQD